MAVHPLSCENRQQWVVSGPIQTKEHAPRVRAALEEALLGDGCSLPLTA
jgi:hypothetical protein